jgi:hypothetical protein
MLFAAGLMRGMARRFMTNKTGKNLVPKKLKRCNDSQTVLLMKDETTSLSDADGGRDNAAGCDAGHHIGIFCGDIAERRQKLWGN